MAAESNGSLKAGNGHAHTNGINGPNGKLNGQTVGYRRAKKQRQSFLAWAFHTFARLATWAAILTVFFRCPSSLETCDETSPYICKPYFQVKNAVSPHIQPYYDQYAAPYVELAKPYYDIVDSKIWTPTRSYAVQYGAPWVERGREQALAQWEKNGQPQLAKFQDLVATQYDQSIGPYVSQTGQTVGPYYDIARTNALQVFYEYLLPSYQFVQPYAVQGYDVASDFTTGTAIPTTYWAWNKTYIFLDTTVWPHVRAFYVENVEPQLVRIGERLGRYKTREKAKASQENIPVGTMTDAIYSSFSKPGSQSSSSFSTASEEPLFTESPKPEVVPEVEDDKEEYLNPVQPPPPAENESKQRQTAREMVAHDLKMWQNKFAKQADDGASDMEERVDTLAKRMIRRNANTIGKDLFQDLESTIESEVKGLKKKIPSFVEAEDAEEQVVAAVRSSGMAIKQKAQAIREWRESYDKDLQETVLSIADIHFQILDETRNLALQRIGMRWAWTDGITYKDWAKYHELKSALGEWTEQLKQLVVTHPTLLEAQDASAQIEDEGMEIASAAAKELGRLKQVARWKIVAKDATDNFDGEEMKQAAEAAGAARVAKEAEIAEPEQPISESIKNAASSVSSYLSDATDAAAAAVEDAEEKVKDYASSIVEPAEEVASSIADVAEEASETVEEQSTAASQSASSILASGEDEVSSTTEDVISAASSSIEGVSSDASSLASEGTESLTSVADDISGTVGSLSSTATESAHSDIGGKSDALPLDTSDSIMDDAQAVVANLSEEPLPVKDEVPYDVEEDPLMEREETPLSDLPNVKPAWLGAAAQAVSDRQPILEDYIDTDIVSSVTDGAQAAYSNAVSRASAQYASAVSIVSAQIYGTPKPVHEQLLSSVSAAYDNAVAAAGAKLSEATEAASTGVKGTTPTTPTIPSVDWERVQSIASQRLDEGRLWAELQYSSALIALNLATATPSSSLEKYSQQAKFNYYAALGLAQDRYSSFMAGASSALSSLTATPTPTDYAGTASSMASVARESAASAAQAAADAAGSAYSAAGDSAGSVYSAAGDNYAAATDAAGSAVSAAGDTIASAAQAVDESVSSVIDAANEQMYIAGEYIADNWDNVVSQISANVYGEPSQIAWYENWLNEASSGAVFATDAAGSSAATASAEASRQYSAVSELVSELIVGKEPTFTESVLSRLQGAYASASASAESVASQASEAAAAVGDKVGSAASAATDSVKETVQHLRDEL